VTYLCLIVIESYVFISTFFCLQDLDRRLVHRHRTLQAGEHGPCNLVRLHWPGLVTLPSGESVPATTWEHYRYGVCRTFGNTHALVWDAFWV
jgi:hypothetical protein